MKRILAGNWKMNLLLAEARALFDEVAAGLRGRGDLACVLFPPATLLAPLAAALREGDPRLGAQNCHFEPKGAFTGEISAEQARDAGASHVLVGHSERRRLFCESDPIARQKLQAAWRAGLKPVLCVGETLAERERRETRDVLARQLRRALEGAPSRAPLWVAYEPVWAIGTGVVATAEEVAEAHEWVREELTLAGRGAAGAAGNEVPILYGGSVDAKNAGPLARTPGVDGFLVGGASLKAASFLEIARHLAAGPPD
ncbi:MAG TPA: triose-phosphate isomerase [Candidatus Limnocylindrales bacterium]|nr:triose-phosphate isomerase [Candidatus Limnocylindrales bacterium]